VPTEVGEKIVQLIILIF